jgi:hypothetical protein
LKFYVLLWPGFYLEQASRETDGSAATPRSPHCGGLSKQFHPRADSTPLEADNLLAAGGLGALRDERVGEISTAL